MHLQRVLLVGMLIAYFGATCLDIALASDQPTTREQTINLLHRRQFCIGEATAQVDLVPSEARELFLHALEAISKRRYDESLTLLDNILKVSPKFALAYFWKGYCYERLFKDASALREFHKGLQISPDEATLYDGLGSLLYREDRLEQALKYFEKAVSLSPTDAYARMYIAYIQKKRMQFDLAVEQLKAADSICPQDEWIEIAMGGVLLEKARNMSQVDTIRIKGENGALIQESDPRQREDLMNQVMKHYDEAIRLAPQWSAAYLAKGSFLEKTEKYSEAMECYRKAIDIDKDSAEPNIYAGNLLVAQKRPSEAINYFDEAIKIDPASGYAHACKAECYAAMNKSDEAIAEYSKAISNEPTNPSWKDAFALYLMKAGRLGEAAQLLKEALKIAPNKFGYHTELARCYREMGNEKAAQSEDNLAVKYSREYFFGIH